MSGQVMFSRGAWDGKHIDALPASPRDPLFNPWMFAPDAAAFISFPPSVDCGRSV